jgi:AraC-like DNA-binding protein
LPVAFVFGQISEVEYYRSKGSFFTTGAAFKPDALRALFRIEAHELTNTGTELDVFAPGRLPAQILELSSPHGRVQLLSGLLIDRLHNGPGDDDLIRQCVQLIHDDVRRIRVSHLLGFSDLSERQFEKRFLRAVGLPAQRFIRIARFKAALNFMRNARFERLTDIAHELNYTDQSHFVRDVKEFSGYTPRGLSLAVRQACEGLFSSALRGQARDSDAPAAALSARLNPAISTGAPAGRTAAACANCSSNPAVSRSRVSNASSYANAAAATALYNFQGCRWGRRNSAIRELGGRN